MFKLLASLTLMAISCLLSVPSEGAYPYDHYTNQYQDSYSYPDNQSCNYDSTPCFPQSGPPGPCGPQGPQGPCGERGPCGECGPQGPCGECGPQGPCGQCGECGPRGPCGECGPQGPCGDCGCPGPCGPCGQKGPCGECGAPGKCGPMGCPGAPGPEGQQGPAGEQGPVGPPGVQGLIGPTGSVGPIGPIGPQGTQGPVGPKGEVGPLGPKGDVGAQGPRGEAGIAGPRGKAGPMGPQGVAGPQGIPGEQGCRGEPGCQGDCGCEGPCGPCGARGPCGLGITGALSASTTVRQQVCANNGVSNHYMESSVEFGGIKFDNCGILLPTKGLYLVTYGVAVEGLTDIQCAGTARFQLSLSSADERAGAVVPGSALSVGFTRELGTILLLLSPQTDGSYLHIQNVSVNGSNGFVPVILNANGGVTAFINVIKLQ